VVAVTRVPTLASVVTDEWNALVQPAGGFYSSHQWLRSLELAHGAGPTLVATRAGRLVGALPTWDGDDSDLFSLPTLAGGLPGRWDGGSMLWLGGRRVTANTPLAEPDVFWPLWAEAREHAAERGRAGLVWPYLDATEARAVAPPGTRVVLHSADAELAVPGGGLTDLMVSARREDRRNWRRELRVFADHGGTVEWRPLTADLFASLAPLIAATRAKHGSPGGPGWVWRALVTQRLTGAAGAGVVCLVRVGSRVAAAAVFYRWHDWLYGRYWGTAGDAPPFSYYVLTHYAAVDWAAEHGLSRLHLSVSSWSVKVSRGARLRPKAMVVDLFHDAPAEPVVREHNAAVAAIWRSRLRRRPEALHISWSEWE
jgi:hypothetical protein